MRPVLAATVFGLALSALAVTPPVPRPAKELTILEPSGKQSLLSQYKGKVCVIQFLYTTCPHCQSLSRSLTKLQNELGPQGLQVFGVAFDEANAVKAANYVRQFGVGFPVGYASRDTVLNYLGMSVMDRFVVPQVIIVDRRGVVRAQSEPTGTAQLYDLGYLTQFVGGLLKEGSAPAAPPAAKKRDTTKKGSS
jgi:peroxiredoxin